MRALTAVFAALALLCAQLARADEGMWPPKQLPAIAKQLKAAGLKLDPGRLDDLDEHPMDAIVSLGFCTASFVSPRGLVVTNHHCAYGAIQYNSTGERNLLASGFFAKGDADELPGDPSLRMYVTERIDDVTPRIATALKEAGDSGRAAFDAVDRETKALVRECEADGAHRCDLYAFHGGQSFALIRLLEIRDVRLVYAPPESIGKFGGDVDNWMWPRHTGDFSFLRAYVGRDGRPAPYSKDNVPYRSKSFLRVDADGLQPGEYAMVLGFPGRTYRWRLGEELGDAIEWTYPTYIAEYGDILKVIEHATKDRADAAVKYASTVASLNNALKNYEGQLEGFAKIDGVGSKRAQEQALEAWIAQRRSDAKLAALRAHIAAIRARRERDLYFGLVLPFNALSSPRLNREGSLLAAASDLYRLSREREKPDAQREANYQLRDEPRIKARLEMLERRYDEQTDRALLKYRLGRYAALPAAKRVPELDEWLGITGDKPDISGIDAKLDAFYAGTAIDDAAQRMKWFDADRRTLEALDDTAMKAAIALYPAQLRIEDEAKETTGRDYLLRPAYMQAMIDFQGSRGAPVYPDANSSLRMTYGKVTGYSPRDGITYEPFTTLRGIEQKTTSETPFDTPARASEAIRAKRHGRYADAKLGDVPVNFLTDLDITGGNSGSPTLNGKGELVGVVFDGNWESVSSSWIFNPALTRAIHVDIRYMLWVMDEVDGAERVIEEMGLKASR